MSLFGIVIMTDAGTPQQRKQNHDPTMEVTRALTPTVPFSSSSKFWMYERCFRLIQSAKRDEYECILVKTSTMKHEKILRIGKDKGRLKEHILECHKGINLQQFEGVPWNPGGMKRVDQIIVEYNQSETQSLLHFFDPEPSIVNTPERDFALWIMAAKVPFYHLQGELFQNFLRAIPKLKTSNLRPVVYQEMELIKMETIEQMNRVLSGVSFINITGDSWTSRHQHFLSVVVHMITNDFKRYLIFPLPLSKLDLLSGTDIVNSVYETVSSVLPGKLIMEQIL